jgi:hypothetical protein
MGVKLGLSLILQEEHRLRVFKNRMLSKVLGHKWDEVKGEWKRLHNDELYDCTPHQIFGSSNQEE